MKSDNENCACHRSEVRELCERIEAEALRIVEFSDGGKVVLFVDVHATCNPPVVAKAEELKPTIIKVLS